jgi:GNAT superfamily N-acetyltransferase
LDRTDNLVVRLRSDDDLDTCVEIVTAVHALDGYPPYVPGRDFHALLTPPRVRVAYVATIGDRVAGHVVVHASRSGAAVELAAAALGCETSRLGIVARLFVAPDRRHAGVGRALLRAAASAARDLDLVPILDVWVELRGAIALYEACGWTRLGSVEVELPDGRIMPELVFAAPN